MTRWKLNVEMKGGTIIKADVFPINEYRNFHNTAGIAVICDKDGAVFKIKGNPYIMGALLNPLVIQKVKHHNYQYFGFIPAYNNIETVYADIVVETINTGNGS